MTRFYVENGVGRRLSEAINLFADNHGCSAVFQHVIHPEMQEPQDGHAWWIEEIADRDHVIITRDLEMFRTESERDAIVSSQARIIGFARASYTAWQMLGGFAWHWNDIKRQLAVEGPWVLKVYAGTTPPTLVDVESR